MSVLSLNAITFCSSAVTASTCMNHICMKALRLHQPHLCRTSEAANICLHTLANMCRVPWLCRECYLECTKKQMPHVVYVVATKSPDVPLSTSQKMHAVGPFDLIYPYAEMLCGTEWNPDKQHSDSLASRRMPTRHPLNNSIERRVSRSTADVLTLSKECSTISCAAVLQCCRLGPKTDNSTDSRADQVVHT